MNILLIEPEHRGHYVALHLNLLIEEFNKRGCRINILTYKKSISGDAYKLINKKILKKINFFYILMTFDQSLSYNENPIPKTKTHPLRGNH